MNQKKTDPLYNFAVKHVRTNDTYRYRGMRYNKAVAYWQGEEKLFDPAELLVISTKKLLSVHLAEMKSA